MKYRYLLAALMLLPLTVLAQTGVYYDIMRNGEGITAYDNGEQLLFYVFTYGAERCDLVEEDFTIEACATAAIECAAEGQDGYDESCVPVTETVCETATGTDISKQCDLNGQRWFLAADDFDGKSSTGILYTATGLDYPFGIPNPEIWKAVFVGEVTIAGLYLMEWDGMGYTMTVVPFGDVDDSDDLYKHQFYFTKLLFP